MGSRIYEKLKSKSGASFIIVLILFFLCVMVSSVVVAAATSGASRDVNRKEQQQAYLSMISALELIVAEMKVEEAGISFVGVEVTKDFGCNTSGSKKLPAAYELVKNDPCEDELVENGGAVKSVAYEKTNLECAFKDLLLEACTQMYESQNQNILQTDYTAKFTIHANDERFTDVYCVFTMDRNYHIKLTMKLTADDTETKSYAMTLNFTGQTQLSTESETLSCTHKIKTSVEQGDGSLGDDIKPLELDGVLTKTYTTVTWDLPTVKKGVE